MLSTEGKFGKESNDENRDDIAAREKAEFHVWVTVVAQTVELEANVQQLQTEQRQAERQLDEVRKEIKSEKLEAAKTEAKTALVAKVGSLLGSNKLKAEREELQQRISTLENQNEELVRHIKTMEQEHKEERTKFNE